MASYRCSVCKYIYDEGKEGAPWAELPDDWRCPVCKLPISKFSPLIKDGGEAATAAGGDEEGVAALPTTTAPFRDPFIDYIKQISETGASVIEPMRTTRPVAAWEEILIKGAQLATIPLDHDTPVRTETVIGPGAKKPIIIDTPVFVTHMSFGTLSKKAKVALATGSAAARSLMCSGEGGLLEESLRSSHKYILEYVPNRYSITEENLTRVDGIEIKIGQSAKPGMGSHLLGSKVTAEVAKARGFPVGVDIVSPASFDDIRNREDLRKKVRWLRDTSGGRPVGIKLAAGHIEADLEVALFAEPDFITIDGRGGATGAAPKHVKDSTSVPTVYALSRARRYMDEAGAKDVSLIITGGLRVASDFAKALAMGADAVAIGTAALISIGCLQARICHTGKCPAHITTQDGRSEDLFDIEKGAKGLENFLNVSTEELKDFARLTGNDDVHKLALTDLCTTSTELSTRTGIEHV